MRPTPLRTTKSARINRQFYRLCLTENFPFVVDLPASRGSYLRTVDGQDIFDWGGYYGSKLVGHNHPRLYDPEYVKRIVVAANNKVPNPDFCTPECLAFYRLAHRLAPRQMKTSRELEVYAVNSGAEVVENMLKYLISRYNDRTGTIAGPRERKFVFFRNSFHGRTIFALSITNVQSHVMTQDFHPLIRNNIQADFPACIHSGLDPAAMARYNERVIDRSLAAMQKTLRKNRGQIVGVIVEPIQGAGGHNCALPRFFTALSELARAEEVPLGFDEVQTGMGGSGKLFYVDHLKLAQPPQALVSAKKFGVGVLYMLDRLLDVGVLDSTWGGPLVDMVRFCQEWKIVRDEKLIPRVAANGKRLRQGLEELEARYPETIFNVRGIGYLQGFTVLPNHNLDARNLLFKTALEKFQLLFMKAAASALRLRPNLSTTAAEVELFLERLDAVLRHYCRHRPKSWTKLALQQRRAGADALMTGQLPT